MRNRLASAFLLVLSLSSNVAARRGGGSGSSGGNADGGNSGEEGSGSNSGGNDGSGSSLPDNRAPCGWWARQETFGIPGLYYDGNITVKHHITHSTVWDDENLGISEIYGCDNDDRSVKTYTYPALLLIAPIGNDSDTNPMHWVLRGFEPPDKRSAAPEVDLWQRWVYIRSSDFVLSNYTPEWDSPFRPYRTYKYEDMDATQLDQTTRVYWRTNITSEDAGVYSARAEYTATPPTIKPDDYVGPRWSPGLRTSQYVTLSNVCHYEQKAIDDPDDIDLFRGDAKRIPRENEVDGDNRTFYASARTLWLSKGATADLSGIGDDSMTLTLNSSLKNAIVWKGMREQGCNNRRENPYELEDFHLSQSSGYKGSVPKPWNMSVSISISFKGSLVRENSTTIEGTKDGKLQFGAEYKITATEEPDNESHGETLRSEPWMWSFMLSILLGVLMT